MRFAVRPAWFLVLAALVSLAACASQRPGPGVECDACAQDEVKPSALAPGGVAQAAAAEGGQRASNQPTQMDPGARGVHTTLSRGTGANTDSSTTTETRSQAGAPSVNQGLILPTTAENSSGGSAAVNEAAKNVAMLRVALQSALASNAPNVDAISKMLTEAQTALANAEMGARPVVTYHLENAVSTQTVANGSKSGGGDGDSITVPKAAAPKVVRAPSAALEAPEPAVPAAPAPSPAPPPAPAPIAPGMGG